MNVGELLVKIGANIGDLKRGVAEAKREVASLPNEKEIRIRIKNDRNFGAFGLSTGTIKALIALAPVASSAVMGTVGALGALTSMLGTASIGAAGFGVAAITTLNDVFDAQKEITKAHQDMAKASTLEEQRTAADNLRKAYVGLNGGQLVALQTLTNFRNSWDDFAKTIESPIILSFVTALKSMETILKNVQPAVMAASNAIATLFLRANEALKNGDMQKFFAWLGTSAGPAITSLGAIFGNTMQGILNLMVAFGPLSDSMQSGLIGMTQQFAQWTSTLAQSQGFKTFIAYVQSVGPKLMTFIGQLTMLIINLLVMLAPVGAKMLDVLNVVLTLVNGIASVFIALGVSLDYAKQKVMDLFNTIKGLLGFQAAATNNQTGAVFDLKKAYDDVVSSVGNVGDGLKNAGKSAEKFLASFDEVYQIPDKLNQISGALPSPTLPTPPTPPTPTSSSGGNGQDGDKNDWIGLMIEKINKIPKEIQMPTIQWPGLGAVVTAFDGLIAKIKEPSPVLATALQAMQAVVTSGAPVVSLGLTALSLALDGVRNSGISLSPAFSATLQEMLVKIDATSPTIATQIRAITDKLRELKGETAPTQTAFQIMLETMMAAIKNSVPGTVLGLVLVIAAITGIVPASLETQTAFHGMLDFMQSKVNAYQPYISFGILGIVLSLIGLAKEAADTNKTWSQVWADMWKTSSSTAPNIVKDINSIRDAQRQLNEEMGKQPSRSPSYGSSAPIESPAPYGPPSPVYAPPSSVPLGPPAPSPIADAWEQFDLSGELQKDALKLGEAGFDMLLTYLGLKGAQAAGNAAKLTLPKIREAVEKISSGQGGMAIPGHALGAVIGSERIVRVGEGNRPEAIIPLSSGAMNPFADAVASRMNGSGGGSGGSGGRDVYIGVLDESQLKQWARQLKLIQIRENQRGLNT